MQEVWHSPNRLPTMVHIQVFCIYNLTTPYPPIRPPGYALGSSVGGALRTSPNTSILY